MLISAVGAVSERLDSKFITAYFFPAFIAVLGTSWAIVTSMGGERFVERIAGLDSVEQGILAALVLLLTMMVAHMLRTMARPIAQLFAGRAFPRLVMEPSLRGQLKARSTARVGSDMVSRGERLFPLDAREMAPTAFGNVLAALADYPRLVYGMDSYHWWPRLLPLLPADFQELLRSLETPMRAMLNLSLVSLYLGCLTAIVLGLAEANLPVAVLSFVIGVVVAEVLYRAAVVQAIDLVRHIWVGFDLYRFQILEQLREQEPASLEEEHALWKRLSQRLRSLDVMETAPAD
jgi:hypothetical protein